MNRGVAARYRIVNLALVGTIVVLLLTGLLALDVTADERSVELLGAHRLPELCLSQRLLGRVCPSCNLGRSVVHGLHGDLAASRSVHAGGLWLIAWTVAQGVARVGLVAAGAPPGWWPIDLGVSVGSFLFVCAMIVAS